MFKIHRFKNTITTNWSGGKTTELLIYPEHSLFSDRNFDFRFSTASIDVENSDFTSLPNYHRILAILDGKLEISHEGKYTKMLQQFEIDKFHGSWKTSSKGKVRDFNVIFSNQFEVKFTYETVNQKFNLSKNGDFLFLLILNESIEIEDLELNKYDLLEIDENTITLNVGVNYFQIEIFNA